MIEEKYCCSKCGFMIEGDCKLPDNEFIVNKETLKEQKSDIDIDDFYICPEFTND
jgi:hypothetical protein